jgi:hypothetical protein
MSKQQIIDRVSVSVLLAPTGAFAMARRLRIPRSVEPSRLKFMMLNSFILGAYSERYIREAVQVGHISPLSSQVTAVNFLLLTARRLDLKAVSIRRRTVAAKQIASLEQAGVDYYDVMRKVNCSVPRLNLKKFDSIAGPKLLHEAYNKVRCAGRELWATVTPEGLSLFNKLFGSEGDEIYPSSGRQDPDYRRFSI